VRLMRSAATDPVRNERGDEDREGEARRATAAATLTASRLVNQAGLGVEALRRRWRLSQRHGLRLIAISPMTCSGQATCATMTIVMLEVKIDRSDPALLHDQVAAQIRRAIADGEAKPGERLPPSRDMAAVLGVNTNTVLRALRLLRDEGLLEFRRGRGIRVTGTPQRGAVLAKALELVQLGRESGYNRAELLAIIEQLP
jgi:GntR family transcriptional regulator